MNTPTIIVASVVALVFVAIIAKSISDRKKGKSSCGCNCSGCAMKGTCYPNE